MHTEDVEGYCFTRIEMGGHEVRRLHAALSRAFTIMHNVNEEAVVIHEFMALLAESGQVTT